MRIPTQASESKLTPNAIQVLLHCHTRPDPHPHQHAPAVQQAIQDLTALGLIERRSQRGLGDEAALSYTTTLRGKAHVTQLCKTPLPVPMTGWQDAQGKRIEVGE